jgi:hypothetical protein
MARWVTAVALLCALPAAAQIRTPGDSAVSEHSGPIGADSRPVRDGSRPVRDGSRTIGESSNEPSISGRLGGSVRDATTRGMRSGPVSSLSRGPMTQPRTLPDGGSMTAHSAGAVKHDRDAPLGSRISEPLRELAPLQAQLRALREHGAEAAVQAAAAPVADPELPAVDPDAARGSAEEARPVAETGTVEALAEPAPPDAAGPPSVPADER